MSHLGYKQTINVDRRTWDKETYEKRAKARLALEKNPTNPNPTNPNPTINDNNDTKSKTKEKEEFIPAVSGSVGPGISKRAYLKSRQNKVDLESKINKTEIISTESLVKSSSEGVSKIGVGWYCKVCDCFLKDSHTYLDHINGRKHQRYLGYTMRVQRSTADDVRKLMSDLAATKNAKKPTISNVCQESFEDIVKKKDEERLARKAARARKREERKKKEEDEYEIPSTDDMAAVMGFSGFK